MRISNVSNATPQSDPPAGNRRAGDEHYIWTSLVPRLIDPAKLALVEALIEAGEPQSVDDLTQLSRLETNSKEIQRHANDMVEAGALEVTSVQVKAGGEIPLYFFSLAR